VLQYALSLGVRPSVDAGGRTVLMQAARAGNRPATVYLLDHAAELGLDPHAVDVAAGESALFYGVRSGSGAVVDTLLDNARLRLTPNAAGRDPVDCALNETGPAASDILRTLLDRFPEAARRRRGESGLTVLHRFVERGQLSMLRRYAPNNYKPGNLSHVALHMNSNDLNCVIGDHKPYALPSALAIEIKDQGHRLSISVTTRVNRSTSYQVVSISDQKFCANR